MSHELLNLFATPVYKASIGRDYSGEELGYFREQLLDTVPAIANVSSRNKKVLEGAPMQGLKELIQTHLDAYFREVYNSSNLVELRVTQSWLSATRRSQSHHTHNHPNSVVSGVLYISLAPDDGINFFRNDDLLWYELIPRQHNYYNAYRYFIETKVGDLVLFPSSLKHGVREVTSDVERISLAFNTFFSGELGNAEFGNAVKISVG